MLELGTFAPESLTESAVKLASHHNHYEVVASAGFSSKPTGFHSCGIRRIVKEKEEDEFLGKLRDETPVNSR